MKSQMRVIVSLQGGACTGKSTVARQLVERGFDWFDRGTFFRSVAFILRNSLIEKDDEGVLNKMLNLDSISIDQSNVVYNGKDITHALRDPQIENLATKIRLYPALLRSVVNAIHSRVDSLPNSVVVTGRSMYSKAHLFVCLIASDEQREIWFRTAHRKLPSDRIWSSPREYLKWRDQEDQFGYNLQKAFTVSSAHIQEAVQEIEAITIRWRIRQ